jgi:hypothetical protein
VWVCLEEEDGSGCLFVQRNIECDVLKFSPDRASDVFEHVNFITLRFILTWHFDGGLNFCGLIMSFRNPLLFGILKIYTSLTDFTFF